MLTGQARGGMLTIWQWARWPVSLERAAREDGYAQALGGQARTYPRPLTPRESEAWREGHAEGRRDRADFALPPVPTWGGDW